MLVMSKRNKKKLIIIYRYIFQMAIRNQDASKSRNPAVQHRPVFKGRFRGSRNNRRARPNFVQ